MEGFLIDENSRSVPAYSIVNITDADPTTTLIKTGAGVLHSITVTQPASGGVIEVDDAITYTLVLDIKFETGLVIYTSVAAQDITITYL